MNMATKREKTIEAITELLYSGCYEATQIIGNGNEEPYEGCERNILIAMCDEETKVEKLASDDPLCRENCNTYRVQFAGFFGIGQIIIWEVE